MIHRLAVVGATGAVGTIVRQLLEERAFPCQDIVFLASERSLGKRLSFRGQDHVVQLLRPEAFEGVDVAIASTPDQTARDFVPWARQRGTVVIDESGYWRMDPSVPLVVPEVNAHEIARHQGVISSPNCSVTQLVVALKPLHDAARIRRVVVSTYQAASGAGLAGSEELLAGSRARLNDQPARARTFAYPLAFNLIPQIGSFQEDGYTSEEWKMVRETQKIFGDDSIQVCPTCIRVPVANCHSESVLVETERPLTANEARALLQRGEGITVVDDLPERRYPMPVDCDGRDDVFVGRIRRDVSSPNGIAFWCVSDNLRKGAATNAVQIAELLAASLQPAAASARRQAT